MQLSRRSRRRRKKWCGDALSFFWVWSLELSPIHPTHTYLFLNLLEQLSCRTQPIELFLFTKVYFQGGMSEAEYRTMFALWALAKVLLHPLAPIVSICLSPPLSSAIANPCFLSVMCDVMRCLPLCPLPNCQSSHRKLGAPSPLAKRISCTLHSYGRCNSDKMEN